jgi:hypothetical protein
LIFYKPIIINALCVKSALLDGTDLDPAKPLISMGEFKIAD